MSEQAIAPATGANKGIGYEIAADPGTLGRLRRGREAEGVPAPSIPDDAAADR
ncbi:hypothetical protein ACWD0Z_26450 [Streptomyces sp. NPDC003007]